jgi:hypothetical protein
MLLVVAGDRERDCESACSECSRPEVEPGPPDRGHEVTRRAAIAAPDSSAFGTKPLAPEFRMQHP